jgi:integrase
VGWYDPEGRRRSKSFGPGFRGKQHAERHRGKLETELTGGTYASQMRKSWDDFRAEYEAKILDGLAPRSRGDVRSAFDHFERIVKPIRVQTISTRHVDQFKQERRKEPGLKKGELLSPATLNKDLRHLKAALNKAVEWEYLAKLPRFVMERELEKLPTYVPPEHFSKLYAACDRMRWPNKIPNLKPADWWRGLLLFGYMTGWRIGSILSLERKDVNLADGTAFSRAKDNKGKRDQRISLHPIVVEHLERLVCFSPFVFPWDHGRRHLFEEFNDLQDLAGVKPAWGRGRYGFHDLRRAFATLNADRLTSDALQAIMQHQDYQTTRRYINLARQLKPAAHNLFVPELSAKTNAT